MPRISGSSKTEEFRSKVSLLSRTSYPIGTIFLVWHLSRWPDCMGASPRTIECLYDKDTEDNPDYYKSLSDYIRSCYPEYADHSISGIIGNVVKLAIKCDVPATEFVSFEFVIDDAPVAFREQLVRNRKSHIWVQTSRTADMTTYDCGRLPSVRLFGGNEAVDIYNNAVQVIRDSYSKLISLGVPEEDIRLQTQMHIHRNMWGITLRDLLKLVGKRSSWIAQASLWAPIISDINNILRNTFGHIIDEFIGINEDCQIKDYHVVSYKYDNEVLDRYYGKDPQPVDPLWLSYKGLSMPEHTDIEFYDYMKSMYIKIWDYSVTDILGWDRCDVSKIGPYDRPRSYYSAEEVEKYSKEYWYNDNSII